MVPSSAAGSEGGRLSADSEHAALGGDSQGDEASAAGGPGGQGGWKVLTAGGQMGSNHRAEYSQFWPLASSMPPEPGTLAKEGSAFSLSAVFLQSAHTYVHTQICLRKPPEPHSRHMADGDGRPGIPALGRLGRRVVQSGASAWAA